MGQIYTGISCEQQEIPAWRGTRLQANLAAVWDIHKKIRHYRERRKLTLEQLAVLVGVSWQTVQQWEPAKTSDKPRTAPSRKRMAKVASVLGVTEEELRSPLPPVETAPLEADAREIWRRYNDASPARRELIDALLGLGVFPSQPKIERENKAQKGR